MQRNAWEKLVMVFTAGVFGPAVVVASAPISRPNERPALAIIVETNNGIKIHLDEDIAEALPES
ncbi:MAG: hypothetical protein PHQ05_08300 [Sterolibacterium sp.]|nr:hypothetical protein [Sterolibacterium sp.]